VTGLLTGGRILSNCFEPGHQEKTHEKSPLEKKSAACPVRRPENLQ
jgi:hypothetical protein